MDTEQSPKRSFEMDDVLTVAEFMNTLDPGTIRVDAFRQRMRDMDIQPQSKSSIRNVAGVYRYADLLDVVHRKRKNAVVKKKPVRTLKNAVVYPVGTKIRVTNCMHVSIVGIYDGMKQFTLGKLKLLKEDTVFGLDSLVELAGVDEEVDAYDFRCKPCPHRDMFGPNIGPCPTGIEENDHDTNRGKNQYPC